MPRDHNLYLEDIRDAALHIETYTRGLTFDEFARDVMRIEAVLYNPTVIGEAVRHIPDEIRSKYPEVGWQKIVGMRNVIAHEYFGIDLTIILDTAQNFVPALRLNVEKMLKDSQA